MPIIQKIDRNKFSQKHVIYKGSSIPFYPLNNHYIYLKKEGGFIDISSIINTGKNVMKFVKNNQDLIKTGVSTVGNLANAVKGISDTVKTSKELEQLKTIKAIQNKKKEEYHLTPEQEEKLKKIGEGFQLF